MNVTPIATFEAGEAGTAEEPKAKPGGARPQPSKSSVSQEEPIPEKARMEEVSHVSLSIHVDGDQRVVYRVIDEKTGSVVRQMPPEEVLRVARSVADLLRSPEFRRHVGLDIES